MANLDLYKLIKEIVTTVTGVPKVILSNPNAPSPSGEYCAISVTQTTRQRSQPAVIMSNVDQPSGGINWVGVNHRVSRNCQTDVSINFYRGSAHEYARKVFGANKRPDISALLLTNNVGWLRSGTVNNLNALQSENWESRAQLSVTLMYSEIDDVVTNGIYKVPIQIENEKGEIILEDVSSTPVGLDYEGYGDAEYGTDQYEPDELIP